MRVRDLVRNTQWFPLAQSGGPTARVRPAAHLQAGRERALFRKGSALGARFGSAGVGVIIVDDGSTDGTADQIRSLPGGGRSRLLPPPPRNVGLPAVAEYEAYRRARADHIAFAFDDDSSFPRASGDCSRPLAMGATTRARPRRARDARPADGAEQTFAAFGRGARRRCCSAAITTSPTTRCSCTGDVLETVGSTTPHSASPASATGTCCGGSPSGTSCGGGRGGRHSEPALPRPTAWVTRTASSTGALSSGCSVRATRSCGPTASRTTT